MKLGFGVGAVACAAVLSGCVTVPGSESQVASWSNGVSMTQRGVTLWEGVTPIDRQEAWARNASGSVQCLALRESYGTGWARTWTLRPGTHEKMFPEMMRYNERQYVTGRYGSWTPADGATCGSPPSDVAIVTLGETRY